MPDHISAPKPGETVSVRVVPGAKRDQMSRDAAGGLRVHLRARAVEGQANQALLQFLAEAWGLKPRALRLIKGLKSRQKLIKIDDI